MKKKKMLDCQLAGEHRLKQLLFVGLFVVALTVCVTSLISLLMLPGFVSNQIAKRLVLKNNSMLLERWSKPNVPMLFKVWLFEVTNAQELQAGAQSKPALREVGPFVFRLKRQKDVVSFAGDNLYYTERRLFHFMPELSCCSINTTLTVPNIPLVAVVDRALSYNLPLLGRFIPRLINRAIQSLREQLFIRRQVRELLFDGYDADLLRMVSRVGSIVGMPQMSHRFALFKGRNDTWRPEQDGVWAINTGATDRQMFGRVSSWNSYRQLPFWSQPACNTINGSDGTLFPPPISRDKPLYVFNPELCRSINLVYERPSDIHAIKALRFVLNPENFARTLELPQKSAGASGGGSSMLDSGAGPGSILERATSNRRQALPQRRLLRQEAAAQPQQVVSQAELVKTAQEAQRAAELRPPRNPHTCFCERKGTHLNGVNVCELDGLIDLSRCSKQAQVIFGSSPHFLLADPRLLQQAAGLRPNASLHTTYLDIEPNTGLVLGGKRRVQLNLLIKRSREVEGFENIADMLVPLVWFEESASIPAEAAQKFRSLYTDRVRKANAVLVGLFLAALGLLAIDARLLVVHQATCSRLDISRRAQKAASAPVATTTTTTNLHLHLQETPDEELSGAGSFPASAKNKSALLNKLAATPPPPPPPPPVNGYLKELEGTKLDGPEEGQH